jgi:hypothetical protein
MVGSDGFFALKKQSEPTMVYTLILIAFCVFHGVPLLVSLPGMRA